MEEREKLCLKTLKEFPREDYVLIGGYASSSFDFPRFSVDLDLVIDGEKQGSFEEKLKELGFFSREGEVQPVEDIYKGKFERFEKEINDLTASMDLLINSVISRQTGSSYSFQYLKNHSEIRTISGFSTDLEVEARVSNREMLIALKTNSMRLSDMRDIIALCSTGAKLDQIMKHLKRCPKKIIINNLQDLLDLLASEQQKDSLKGVFSISDQVHERITSRAEATVRKLLKRLKEQDNN